MSLETTFGILNIIWSVPPKNDLKNHLKCFCFLLLHVFSILDSFTANNNLITQETGFYLYFVLEPQLFVSGAIPGLSLGVRP